MLGALKGFFLTNPMRTHFFSFYFAIFITILDSLKERIDLPTRYQFNFTKKVLYFVFINARYTNNNI